MISQTVRSLLFPMFLVLSPASDGRATPRIQMHEWSERLRPAVFEADTTAISWMAYPPARFEDSRRPEISARWLAKFPEIDGVHDDWPLIRWQQVRQHTAVVRGDWQGAADASMRFAVLWNETGVLIGFEVTDDRIVEQAAAGRGDAFFVTFGSQSESVQRWWRGADRTIQMVSDGRLISTTFLRNRKRVLFDSGALGAQGAVQVERLRRSASAEPSPGGILRAELFVPWDVLFPLLPSDSTRPLINVFYEDVDEDEPTLLAAATRVEDSKVEPSWSRLAIAGEPPSGTTVLSASSRHLEPGVPLEWAAMQFTSSTSWTLKVTAAGEELETSCPAGPLILRLEGLQAEPVLWQRQRRIPIRVAAGDWSADRSVFVAPDATVLSGDLAELDQLEAQQDEKVAFPRVADVYVRLKNVTGVTEAALGEWHERRFHDSGIAVWRASMWQLVEKRIARAELLRDQIVDPVDSARRWQEAFPECTDRGIPIGKVLTRGYRSAVDGSIQPYALFVSRQAAAQESVPLIVGLHSIKKNELDLFESTHLAKQTETRGWIAVCPYGRGDTGFSLTGEIDALDVIAEVIRDLPVDRQRLYALGSGMGGTGAWLLSLRHPDLFSAAAIVSSFGDMDQQDFYRILGYHPRELFHYETMNPIRLVRPGLVTRYRILHSAEDAVVPVAHARVMHRKLKEYEAHSDLVVEPGGAHGEALMQKSLSETLDFFAAAPRAASGRINPQWFGGTGGPLATVFPRGPFSIVYGTQSLPDGTPAVGDKRRAGKSVTGPDADVRTARQFALEWQSIYKGRPRLLADSAFDPTLAKDHNLVLVGDPRTNSVLRGIADQLPVQWNGDQFTIAGRTYSFEEHGVMFATPHPFHEGRTVIVVSAMGERLGNFEKSLLKLGTDYIVTDDQHRFVDLGQFDQFVIPRTPGGGR